MMGFARTYFSCAGTPHLLLGLVVAESIVSMDQPKGHILAFYSVPTGDGSPEIRIEKQDLHRSNGFLSNPGYRSSPI